MFCLKYALNNYMTIICHNALGCQGKSEFPTRRGVALLTVPLHQKALYTTYFTILRACCGIRSCPHTESKDE